MQATKLFKEGKAWFDKALLLYKLDGYVSEHIPICQVCSLCRLCGCERT